MIQKPVLHLLITTLCDRNCKYCCNKQYDMNSIPYVTKEELQNVDTVCLTGGEPFKYSNPCAVAQWLKDHYPNIKNVYVYTNAKEFFTYCSKHHRLYAIDGLSMSIKNKEDLNEFNELTHDIFYGNIFMHPKFGWCLKSNYLYIFDNLYPYDTSGFKVINRKWQEDFKPADNSIFRRI